jgi:hypothetical protein
MDQPEFKGKPVFEVSFLDFCKIANRTEKRTKFVLESQELLNHIKENRYSKNYVVEFGGIKVDASSVNGNCDTQGN